MRNENILREAFATKISKQRFDEHCEAFNLDPEEAAQDLRMRGYRVMSI